MLILLWIIASFNIRRQVLKIVFFWIQQIKFLTSLYPKKIINTFIIITLLKITFLSMFMSMVWRWDPLLMVTHCHGSGLMDQLDLVFNLCSIKNIIVYSGTQQLQVFKLIRVLIVFTLRLTVTKTFSLLATYGITITQCMWLCLMLLLEWLEIILYMIQWLTNFYLQMSMKY